MNQLAKLLFINQLENFNQPFDFPRPPLDTSSIASSILSQESVKKLMVYNHERNLLNEIIAELEIIAKERCTVLEKQIAELKEQHSKMKTKIHNLEEECAKLRLQITDALEHIDDIYNELDSLIQDKERLKTYLTIVRDLLRSALTEPEKPSGYRYNIEVIKMTILLIVHAGCSLRSAVMALSVFRKYVPYLFKSRVPAYTTAREWVMKGGLALAPFLNKRIIGKYIFIVDESIALNKQKMLVILAAPANPTGTGPLSFRDVSIVIMETREKWEHTDVMEKLREAKKIMGRMPQYVLSDEGKNIVKAVQELHWNQHRDVAHAAANVLKHTYLKDERFNDFLKDLGSYKHLTLSVSAPFAPPKQRSKARFLNLTPSIRWAVWIIDGFELLDDISQERFKKICTKHRGIVAELSEVIEAVEKILKLLKNEGLSLESVNKSKTFLSEMPRCYPGTLKVKEEFIKYLDEESKLLRGTKDCHAISSDIIESFFSVVKRRLPNAKYYGYTEYSLSMYVRLYVDTPDDFDGIDIYKALGSISLKDVEKWRTENTVESAYRKRKEHKKKMVMTKKASKKKY